MARKPESTQSRKGMPSPRLGEAEFKRRFLDQFQDPAFSSLQAELRKMADTAWDGYSHSRKSPHTFRAGKGYADPDYQLAGDWINAAEAVRAAGQAHRKDGVDRILLINASPRSEHTCPGEMSKSYRLAQIAQNVLLRSRPRSMCLTCRDSLRSTDARSTRAKRASQPRRRFVIGPAPVIQTIRSGRCTTG